MSEETIKAIAEFDAAAKKLNVAGKVQGVENRYAAAYQALVRLGVRPQLRRKYR